MAKTESKKDDQDTITMTQNVSIPKSRVVMDPKSLSDPKRLEAEEKRQTVLAEKRKVNRIAKLKAKPKTPAQVRKALLGARLKRVQDKRPHSYRKEQLIAWGKEYQILKNNPKSWKPGCTRAKKQKSAQDFIDGLQIED